MAYFKRLFYTIFYLRKTTLSHNKLNKRNYEYFFSTYLRMLLNIRIKEIFMENIFWKITNFLENIITKTNRALEFIIKLL